MDNLENRFYTLKSEITEDFQNNTIDEIFDYIESDVSNSEVEEKLKRIIEKNQKNLEKDFLEKIEFTMNEFKNNTEEIISQLKKYLENILSYDYSFDKIENFDIELKIDNGIKVGKLIMTLVGGALILWNPIGWIGIVLGAGSVILGLFDSVDGFFSSSYKRSQQKKSATKNINKFFDNLNKVIENKIEEIMPEIKEKMKEIKKQVETPLEQIREINKKIKIVNRELKELENKVKIEGEL